jgi:hypothetical protein
MAHYNICSNPDCTYSRSVPQFDHHKQPYCPKCGSEVWYSCPHCKELTLEMRNQKYCTKCRKEIKPPPASPGRKGR